VCRPSLAGAGSDNVQDHGVLLGLAERFEGLARPRVCDQGGGEVGRDGGFFLGLISGVPPSVGLGGLDLGET
jgi:hypothetical protein